jgi:surface protein
MGLIMKNRIAYAGSPDGIDLIDDLNISTDTAFSSNKVKDLIDNFYEYVETTDTYGADILKYPIGRYKIGNKDTITDFKNTPNGQPGVLDVMCPISNDTTSPFEVKYAYRYYRYVVYNGDTYERTLESGYTAGYVFNDTGWKEVIYANDMPNIDDQLSAVSENPVQNKAIKTYIDDMGYLYSPSGLKYKLLVADDGTLSTISVNQINVFTFDTSKVSGSTTVILQDYTGSTEEYDGTTDWGDGTTDTSLTHTYTTDGVYTVETKYLINKSSTGDSNTRKMLTGCTAINSEISDYSYMFYNCTNLTELNANSWDTTKVTNMSNMFCGCSSLETLNISKWNTSNVVNMNKAFGSCSKLLTLDVNDWDVSNVTDMTYMFASSGLTEIDLTKWNTKNVTDISYMFNSCKSLTSITNTFNTSKVKTVQYMFNNCTLLNNVDTNWNTQNVTNMDFMFNGCSALTALDVSGWDTSNVTDMDSMFQKAGIKNLDLSSWDVSSVKNMMYMFTYGTFETININNWNAEECSNIMYLFGACQKLHTLYADNVTFSKATNMMSFFYGDSALTSLDLSTWKLPLLGGMPNAFMMCSGLTSLNLSGWDVTKVINLQNAFAQCTALTDLNISGWDITNDSINTSGAFNKTTALTLDGIDMTDCSDTTVTKITDAFNARTA